jgi:hypothetical protein
MAVHSALQGRTASSVRLNPEGAGGSSYNSSSSKAGAAGGADAGGAGGRVGAPSAAAGLPRNRRPESWAPWEDVNLGHYRPVQVCVRVCAMAAWCCHRCAACTLPAAQSCGVHAHLCGAHARVRLQQHAHRCFHATGALGRRPLLRV